MYIQAKYQDPSCHGGRVKSMSKFSHMPPCGAPKSLKHEIECISWKYSSRCIYRPIIKRLALITAEKRPRQSFYGQTDGQTAFG